MRIAFRSFPARVIQVLISARELCKEFSICSAFLTLFLLVRFMKFPWSLIQIKWKLDRIFKLILSIVDWYETQWDSSMIWKFGKLSFMPSFIWLLFHANNSICPFATRSFLSMSLEKESMDYLSSSGTMPPSASSSSSLSSMSLSAFSRLRSR